MVRQAHHDTLIQNALIRFGISVSRADVILVYQAYVDMVDWDSYRFPRPYRRGTYQSSFACPSSSLPCSAT
jgi:hypothetical protein